MGPAALITIALGVAALFLLNVAAGLAIVQTAPSTATGLAWFGGLVIGDAVLAGFAWMVRAEMDD